MQKRFFNIKSTKCSTTQRIDLHSMRGILFLFGLIMVASACSQEEPLTRQQFNEDSLEAFVEPDFPFITTSLDGRELGQVFPNSVTPRCIAVKFEHDAYGCFDTDLLRWSVTWTGDFVSMTTMAQTSYRDFHNKSNELPIILGDPVYVNGMYPGGFSGEPDFQDPRLAPPAEGDPSWGPIPADMGRWNGLHLQGDNVILDYTLHGTHILERPGAHAFGNHSVITRTFHITGQQGGEPLTLAVAEILGTSDTARNNDMALLYQGETRDTVTAIGVIQPKPIVQLNIQQKKYVTARLPETIEQAEFTLAIWRGAVEHLADFENELDSIETSIEPIQLEDGQFNPKRWTENVKTAAHTAPDSATFVQDYITLPIPNPWGRNMRAVDIDFFSDGRAAVVTFDGDIWLAEEFGSSLDDIIWRRFASGLYETQSIEIVDDAIYTFGREGIIKLHDYNNDGEADFYQNYSNLMVQSMETRQWASDMVAGPDGSFYVSQFGALNMGPPTSSPKIASGFRAGTRHSGAVVKITENGRKADVFATGFRGPYLGIHPETGQLSASDQQGHYVPSSPIMLVDEGDYFGVEATAHRNPLPEASSPLMWIPHSVDRSGMQQIWMHDSNMGPLNRQMIHLSYGRPGLFNVLIDTADNMKQGGVSAIKGIYKAPAMKGAVNPVDGMLYVTGFSLWGSNTQEISSLFRLRYTGGKSTLPSGFKVIEQGIMLKFETRLTKQSAQNTGHYQVKRWNYKRTGEYGSGHYKTDGSAGEAYLPVFSAHLSEDRTKIFLAIPDIKKVMQMQISYELESENGVQLNDDFWFTVHQTDQKNLADYGFDGLNVENILLDAESKKVAAVQEESVSAERGRELFHQTGCNGCHSLDGATEGYYGPSVKNLFGSKRNFEDAHSEKADSTYIAESILNPSAKVISGYDAEMPSFKGILTESDVGSIIRYIKTLSEKDE